MYFSTLLLFCLYSGAFSQLEIQNSGLNDVEKFSTVLTFFLEISNSDRDGSDVTAIVVPEQCCLEIESNDIDCQILKLGAEKKTLVSPYEAVSVTFSFRNLYVMYRKGHCKFLLMNEERTTSVAHTITFNTYPNKDDYTNCTGVDHDPDRDCIPVDCAIKYKGHRNYYNVTKGKCLPVVECNTRGKDGVTVIAYYDWKTNQCVQYEWFSNDNYFNQVESDTEIPADIDPSQMKYYPDLEPELMMNSSTVLDCNHGVQSGFHCECDKGWMSSGIHYNKPLVFHWCDELEMNGAALVAHAPRKLSKAVEYFSIFCLCIANAVLLVLWVYLSMRLVCPSVLMKIKRVKSRLANPGYD